MCVGAGEERRTLGEGMKDGHVNEWAAPQRIQAAAPHLLPPLTLRASLIQANCRRRGSKQTEYSFWR